MATKRMKRDAPVALKKEEVVGACWPKPDNVTSAMKKGSQGSRIKKEEQGKPKKEEDYCQEGNGLATLIQAL